MCNFHVWKKWNTGIDAVPSVGDLGTQSVRVLGSISTFFCIQRRWLGLIGLWEGLVGGEEVPRATHCPCKPRLAQKVMWWRGTILAGVNPIITGSEAGLTYEDYSDPLMDGRLWPRLTRKQIATLSPSKVLFCQVKNKKKREPVVFGFLGNFFSIWIFVISALNFLQPQKHKDPYICNLWILVSKLYL